MKTTLGIQFPWTTVVWCEVNAKHEVQNTPSTMQVIHHGRHYSLSNIPRREESSFLSLVHNLKPTRTQKLFNSGVHLAYFFVRLFLLQKKYGRPEGSLIKDSETKGDCMLMQNTAPSSAGNTTKKAHKRLPHSHIIHILTLSSQSIARIRIGSDSFPSFNLLNWNWPNPKSTASSVFIAQTASDFQRTLQLLPSTMSLSFTISTDPLRQLTTMYGCRGFFLPLTKFRLRFLKLSPDRLKTLQCPGENAIKERKYRWWHQNDQ